MPEQLKESALQKNKAKKSNEESASREHSPKSTCFPLRLEISRELIQKGKESALL
jgi:hypothetical protein